MKVGNLLKLFDGIDFINPGKHIDLNAGFLKNTRIESIIDEPVSHALGRIFIRNNKLVYDNGSEYHYLLDISKVIANSTSINLNYDAGTDTLTAAAITATLGGLEVTAGGLQLKDVGTSGTYTKVTTDAKGRVTSGAQLSASDIPSHSHAHTDITDFDTGVRQNAINQLAVPIDHLNLNNKRITSLADPVNAQDAANKRYVDDMIAGAKWKDSVRVATTADITLSGTQSIDGITLSVGDRVLVKNQSIAAQNGIYEVSSTSWSRTTDADAWAELISSAVWIEEGTVNGDSGWVCTVDSGGTLDTTDVTWSQFTGGASIVDGAGLSKSGNELSVNVDNETIEITSDILNVKFDSNSGLTSSATGTKLDISSDFVLNNNKLELASSLKHQKYTTTIAANTSTSETLTHNFGTKDVVVQIFENSGSEEAVIVDWWHSTTNTIVVDTNNYNVDLRVVVMG